MKTFWERVIIRAAETARKNRKKAKYNKRIKNRQKLYNARKSLGRV